MRISIFLTLGTFVCACSGSAEDLGGKGQPLDQCQMGAAETCVQANKDLGEKHCQPGEQGYVWGACEPAPCTGTTVSCTTSEGQTGLAQCREGKTASPCGAIHGCKPGDVWICPATGPIGGGSAACMLGPEGWDWPPGACSTPLVLAFHGERVHFTRPAGGFDLLGAGTSVDSDWVDATTPWLALDRNDNGIVDDGRELFGSMTELPTGVRASNGFVALAELDEDGDGWITARDASFSRLLVWSDRDQDRRSSAGELTRAEDIGIVAVSLGYRNDVRCAEGSCEIERARFVFRDERGVEQDGQIVDVHLAPR
jgi:hypothetical protein